MSSKVRLQGNDRAKNLGLNLARALEFWDWATNGLLNLLAEYFSDLLGQGLKLSLLGLGLDSYLVKA